MNPMSDEDKIRLSRISNGLYYNRIRLKEFQQHGGDEPKWIELRRSEHETGEAHVAQ